MMISKPLKTVLILVAVTIAAVHVAAWVWIWTLGLDSWAWYEALCKPFFAPPSWVFECVFGLLSLPMGIAVCKVWRRCRWGFPTRIFIAQAVLSLAWAPLFFGVRHDFLALTASVTLCIGAVSASVLFFYCARRSALLMLPSVAWDLFLVLLTGWVWWMNKSFTVILTAPL